MGQRAHLSIDDSRKIFSVARNQIPIHWPSSQVAHCYIKDTKARRVKAGEL
jgi:hypothetical protein